MRTYRRATKTRKPHAETSSSDTLTDVPNTAACASAPDTIEWTNDSLAGILMLVDHLVPMDVIQTWSIDQFRQAGEWASAVHLHASDNEGIVVPPKPDFLSAYENKEVNLDGFVFIDAFPDPLHKQPAPSPTPAAGIDPMQLAVALFGKMPEILTGMEQASLLDDNNPAGQAMWLTEVAKVLATELGCPAPLPAPVPLAAPTVARLPDGYVAVARKEIEAWEAQINQTQHAGFTALRSRMLCAAVADTCFPAQPEQ